jgi:hypothetical protein
MRIYEPTPAGAMSEPARSKPRPPIFRALGAAEPPHAVTVAGNVYTLHELMKHDSWAATGIYAGPAGKITCKFNRRQPVFGCSMRWLGRLLADNERMTLERLGDVPNIPNSMGDVYVDGEHWPNAIARVFIPGHPLGRNERVSPTFFAELKGILETMHARRIAYVDLHKRENIIVGADGKPYLIDFQIGLDAARKRVAWIPGIGHLFEILSGSDFYHLSKHIVKHEPERRNDPAYDLDTLRPWWIKLHRKFAVPFRELRRRLLVVAKVRTGKGEAETEVFAEDAIRNDAKQAKKAA